jgi:hypothetical protein
MKVKKPDWSGKTVVCIASGPSLTEEDCELVRQSGHVVIVANTTFRLAPWADALFAFDVKWWDEYHKEVDEVFKGRRFGYSTPCVRYGAESLFFEAWFNSFSNSGACAVGLAIAAGAKKIVMLGYDCQKTDGKVHWHPDHPSRMSEKTARKRWPGGMANAESIKRWPSQFKNVRIYADNNGARVINASRVTALDCFERANLEDVL